MSFKINPALATIIIAGILILLFALIRGCNNNQQAIAFNKQLIAKNDSLKAKIKRDSIESVQNKNEYESKLEVSNGQIEIKDNQIARTEDELSAANKRINALLAKHKEVIPNPDSSNTYVPNDFITDCNGCFTELENGQQLVKKYQSDIDQLKLSYLNKDKLQTNRINQQEQEKANLTKTLQDCMDISKAAQKAGTPKGQLYFSWNILWNPWPSSAGAGIMYQTKYRIQYGATYYYGRYGQMIQTQINLPLSLKKRKYE